MDAEVSGDLSNNCVNKRRVADEKHVIHVKEDGAESGVSLNSEEIDVDIDVADTDKCLQKVADERPPYAGCLFEAVQSLVQL